MEDQFAPAPSAEKLVLDKKALLKWVVGLVIVGGAITVFAIVNNPEAIAEKKAAEEAERIADSAPTYAEMACKDQVKSRLRAPATAQFSDVWAQGDGNGNYEVTGNVDAENGFGALLRSGFSCDVVVDGQRTSTSNVVIS